MTTPSYVGSTVYITSILKNWNKMKGIVYYNDLNIIKIFIKDFNDESENNGIKFEHGVRVVVSIKNCYFIKKVLFTRSTREYCLYCKHSCEKYRQKRCTYCGSYNITMDITRLVNENPKKHCVKIPEINLSELENNYEKLKIYNKFIKYTDVFINTNSINNIKKFLDYL